MPLYQIFLQHLQQHRMEIFFCTFIIKLQYVKRGKESTLKKGASSTFQALLKSSKNTVIASGNSKPSLMNDTAWFNERFEINSDLLFNTQTKTYNQSLITLEIRTTAKYSNNSYTKSFNLAEIAEKKVISERQYALTGGLIANIQLCCSYIESKGIKPLRRSSKSAQKSEKSDEAPSFLMIQKVSFSGQPQRETGRDTPQFHERSFKQTQEQIDSHPLVLEEAAPQLNGLKQQFHKELQEHQQTKNKLRATKQLLEKEYHVNRQQKIAIIQLQKELILQKQAFSSLEIHLSETESLCTALSATLNHKQTEIIELYAQIQQYKLKLTQTYKKLETINPLERAKAQLQWQIGALKKQIENLKILLNKQYLSENQMRTELDQIKLQNTKLKNLKDKTDFELIKAAKSEKQNSSLISKLTEQKDLIKRQTTKWRTEFAAQSQRKDEQINQLQEHYSQLFNRYQQMLKKVQLSQVMVAREVYDNTVKNFEKKLQQNEQKQSKLREQLEIIEEQIANLQSLLEQKQENQEILLDHIKKLQKEVNQYAISDNWWSSILQKNQSSVQSHQNNSTDQKSKLISKNQQLIQLLQKNSKIILEGDKLKLEIATLKKQNEQLLQKELILSDQYKEVKQKIASLYKQNKKLQEKNAKLIKENELINKKNLWLEEEITQCKLTQKEARQDYQIISFQLFKMQTVKEKKQKREKQKASLFLSVINQNSQQLLTSSHNIIQGSQARQKSKNGYEEEGGTIDNAVFEELTKILEQRAAYSQQIQSHLQKLEKQSLSNSLEDLQKQLKKISLSTSRIKTVLVKSGNKQYVKQWEGVISSLSDTLQHFICSN